MKLMRWVRRWLWTMRCTWRLRVLRKLLRKRENELWAGDDPYEDVMSERRKQRKTLRCLM